LRSNEGAPRAPRDRYRPGPAAAKPSDPVGATGFEPHATSAPGVAKSGLEDAERATQGDAKQREVSASGDVVEAALVKALGEASAAGRFDVVALLAGELQARRFAGGGVVTLEAKRRQRGS